MLGPHHDLLERRGISGNRQLDQSRDLPRLRRPLIIGVEPRHPYGNRISRGTVWTKFH